MASQKFTPINVVDMSKERDWAASLGLLDWDNTSIVFTKRSLIEFLRYTGTTVDTNNTNIAKLPRYAKFGKLESLPAEATRTQVVGSVPEDAGTTTNNNAEDNADDQDETNETTEKGKSFRPSRRVRTIPGGKDSLSDWWGTEETEEFKPTRRVRQTPGGQDNMAGILG